MHFVPGKTYSIFKESMFLFYSVQISDSSSWKLLKQKTTLSNNILCAGNKLPIQRGFSGNNAGHLLYEFM